MYQEFGKIRDWKRIIVPLIVIVIFFSAPFSVFLIYIAVDSNKLGVIVAAIVMVSFIWIFPLQHLRNLYNFPTLEIDDNFLVVNQIFQKRAVYTLKKITLVKPFMKSALLIHNGFPVLLNMNSLEKDDRKKVVRILTSATKGN